MTPTDTPTVCPTQIGVDTIGGSSADQTGFLQTEPITIVGTHDANYIQVYTSAVGNIRGGIYTDSTGAPDALLVESDSVPTITTPGWTLIP
ncbi:MAG TPA: hypothetical protein VLK33_19850, partial [Terriglobales bacterium]|nr:hypothetical protein [Terriglobales bacterium]